ncbi:MAG: hypothetical protein K0R00_3868 [Herbinix sp.]|nr:hypothetical protein [Herbinix sp.]
MRYLKHVNRLKLTTLPAKPVVVGFLAVESERDY